jgi:hypothetical protein
MSADCPPSQTKSKDPAFKASTVMSMILYIDVTSSTNILAAVVLHDSFCCRGVTTATVPIDKNSRHLSCQALVYAN